MQGIDWLGQWDDAWRLFTNDEHVGSQIALLISFASYNDLHMQEPSEPVFMPMLPTH